MSFNNNNQFQDTILNNSSLHGLNSSSGVIDCSNSSDNSSLISISRGSSKSTSIDVDGNAFVRKPIRSISPANMSMISYDFLNPPSSMSIRTRFYSSPFDENSQYVNNNNSNNNNNNNNNNNTPKNKSIFGFSTPLTISWFFSVIGTEYCHTYFWIFKDLAWMQGWRKFSVFFGLSALLWSLSIFYHGARTCNLHELWNFVALFLWLFANFWWMIGEAYDYEYPYEDPIGDKHTTTSSQLLTIALCWLLIYYIVILPFHLIPLNKQSLAEYDDGQLKPRLFCFKSFRQYENLHMLFWIAKDLAWVTLNIVMWFICFVPAILIAADFVYLSAIYSQEDSSVKIIHYAVVLIWVIGNSVWALGDLFVDNYNDPLVLWTRSADSLKTARWYSSWILLADLVPVFLMYSMWIALTYSGKLSNNYNNNNNENNNNNNNNNNRNNTIVDEGLNNRIIDDSVINLMEMEEYSSLLQK